MRGWQRAGWICWLASSLAWAGNARPVSPAGGQPAPAGAWPATVDRQLSQHEAEVSRLRKEVAMEESDSRKAGERLDQQDRTIAKLQRQLQAIRTAGPAPGGP